MNASPRAMSITTGKLPAADPMRRPALPAPFCLILAISWWWLSLFEEGFVKEPASGQVVELTGVPGDQIRLQIPVGAREDKTPGDFYATLLYDSATALEELPDSRDQAAIHWRIET